MRKPLAFASVGIAVAALAAAGCGAGGHSVCANGDGALTNAAFVFVEGPRSGDRVTNGFDVSGCSSTFEATIDWSLRARDGRVLAHGVAQGGGLEAGTFHFAVRYSVRIRQIGQLEVNAPSITREGFPPVRNALPLVLRP
jgi:hypothetical protein